MQDREKYPFRDYSINFYIKRALRLFPLYFAYLFACLLVNALFSDKAIVQATVADVADHAKYLLTFTYNLMPFINQALGQSYEATVFTRHLWTISLEEQFYLVFPLIFFFFDIKAIKRIILAAIILAPVFRFLFYIYLRDSNPDDVVWASVNLSRIPFAQMDSLAFGSALALFNTDWIRHALRWWLVLLVIIVVIYLANMYYVYYVQGLSYYQVTYGLKIAEKWITHNYLFSYIITLVNFWCALTLLCVRRNERINPFLEFKPLVFLGKLSYGVYILHLPILHLFLILNFSIFHQNRVEPYWLHEGVLFILYFITVVAIAYISFTYFESYFLGKKNKWTKKLPVNEPAV
jgi:peptidoglycan/LPS O-acetylase OafA/YrhL